MNARARGFTLIEMIVAITISAIVVVFAALLIAAPVDAYEANGRRALMVDQASTAWPLMQSDLRDALPNSVRVRRNGTLVAMELLSTIGYARYLTPHGNTFRVAGTTRATFGNYPVGSDFVNVHLSVNNSGEEAYTETASMTPRLSSVTTAPLGASGNSVVQVSPVFPAINWDSPRNRVYLVRGAITYLCDEQLGTVTRYYGYPLAPSQAARDTPAELAGATSADVVARGISACSFGVVPLPGQPQTITVRLTTTRNNESVTLMHSAMLEHLP
jgi:MSHA biogenesis protein MshO